MPTSWTPEPVNDTLLGKIMFAGKTKDLEMRRLLDYQMSPKSKGKHPSKRDTQRRLTQRRKHVKTEANAGMMWPQTKEASNLWKLAKEWSRFSPRASVESVVLPTPWIWTSGLENYEKINFSCFKPQICDNLWERECPRPPGKNLWSFVMTTPGH